MGLTTDVHDGCLHEELPNGQMKCYLVLDDGRRKDLLRPVRRKYIHSVCGAVTIMNQKIAETYAADPSFYGATFCSTCGSHFPVGENGQFVWDDGSGEKVGT